MAIKKRVIGVKRWIRKRLFAWRMRRIVKKYEKEHRVELVLITLQEEYIRCFQEYLEKYGKST